MVRNYVKKGGHGGARGGGLPPAFWDDRGGRAAAGVLKAERKAKATANKKTAVDVADAQWRSMLGTSQNAQNAHSEQPAAELRRSPRKAAAPSSSTESAARCSDDAAANASCSSEQL
jgi:hypothetical protein